MSAQNKHNNTFLADRIKRSHSQKAISKLELVEGNGRFAWRMTYKDAQSGEEKTIDLNVTPMPGQ
ncbi:MAG: hypothetical protein AAFR38_01405 [Planctomycetota bacterium]